MRSPFAAIHARWATRYDAVFAAVVAADWPPRTTGISTPNIPPGQSGRRQLADWIAGSPADRASRGQPHLAEDCLERVSCGRLTTFGLPGEAIASASLLDFLATAVHPAMAGRKSG